MPAAVGKKVGVLALQGSVEEHLKSLERCGVQGLPVKTKIAFDGVDGLIIPGGESTTMGKLLRDFDLLEDLKKRIQEGLPVWGTCAGLILLAKHIEGEAPHLAVMDITVRRNAYGAQLDSFKTAGKIPEISPEAIPMVFIRAPYIKAVGPSVTVLATHEAHITAAREKNMLVTAFHPELTPDTACHRYFLEMLG